MLQTHFQHSFSHYRECNLGIYQSSASYRSATWDYILCYDDRMFHPFN